MCLHRVSQVSQRELPKNQGVELYKISFYFWALLEKALLKVHNFKQTESKLRLPFCRTRRTHQAPWLKTMD
jgi:hypothetical protein